MKTEFALFNPASGDYVRTDSREAAVIAAAQIAADFYFSHAHGTPMVMIKTDDSGTETWTAPDGSTVMSPAEVAAQFEASERHRLSFENAGEIPVTTL